MTDCIFCKIISGEIPSPHIYHDQQATAFADIHPVAPVHILIVPNEHISSNNDLKAGHEALVGHLFIVAAKLAEQKGIAQSGYRLIVNNGPDAGQEVFHLHVHLIGGNKMRYPMG
jgi:histidine triad (HIT) family protein